MSKTKHQRRVEKLMKKAGQNLPKELTMPTSKERLLRVRLILEECLETIEALGFDLCGTGQLFQMEGIVGMPIEMEEICLVPNNKESLVGIADGCADVSVVTIGTLSACGIEDESLLLEVDENNLKKFGPGGYKRDDGKWVKPADHQPPNIAKVIGAEDENSIL